MSLRSILTDARSGLIDLSFANPLLNYKRSKKRGLSFQVNNILKFLQELDNEAYQEILLAQTTELTIPIDGAELLSRARFTKSEAKIFLEEKGVNVLFLAVGFVNWVEDQRSDLINRSPLFLIPVRLSVDNDILPSFSRLEDDLQENFALIEKYSSLGVRFPRWGEDQTFEGYLADLQSLKSEPIIKSIELNTCAIDIFKTQKYFMYEDLNPDFWEEELIQSKAKLPEFLTKIIDNGLFDVPDKGPNEDEIDALELDVEPLLVKDADLSQYKTILNARNGKSFIIQGPPGTGKSQTITNLIADLVYQGKKILFVSEKSTALDVVRDNLAEVGLGRIILDLHDSDARKVSVLKDIEETIDFANSRSPEVKFSPEEYYATRVELKKIRDLLKQIIGDSGLKIENVLINLEGIYEYFRNKEISFSSLNELVKSKGIVLDESFQSFKINLEIIRQYQKIKNELPDNLDLIFSEIRILRHHIVDHVGLLSMLEIAKANLGSHKEMQAELPKGLLQETIERASSLHELAILKPVLLGQLSESDLDEIKIVLAKYKKIEFEKNGYQGQIKDLAWTTPITELKKALIKSNPGWMGFLVSPKRREYLSIKNSFFHESMTESRVIELIRAVEKYQNAIILVRETIKNGALRNMLVNKNAEGLNISLLNEFLADIVDEFQILSDAGIFNAVINSHPEEINSAYAYLYESETIKEDGSGYKIFLESLLKIEDTLGIESGILRFKSKEHLNKIFKILPEALNFRSEWNRLSELSLLIDKKSLRWTLQQNNCPPDYLYSYTYFNQLKRKFDLEDEILKNHSGISIENTREEYRKLDLARKNYCRDLILKKQSTAVHDLLNIPTQNFTALIKIFKKVRNIPPIRKVISNCFDEISNIKPVFMMSPLSVATFIPKKLNYFDFVVFDEASQIKPSDAFGAILRSKNAIIVGDSMQLPPTKVFDSDLSGADSDSELFDVFDEENTASGINDIRSILDFAGTVRMPSYRLNWHYRSKFASLIAVSNSEFYDWSLVTFPDARPPNDNEGVRFTYIENGNYERATTRKNTNEAQAVVDAIFKHITAFPKKSLGVVTFSVAQKEAIEERLQQSQLQRNLLSEFNREHSKEPFFIKNIERVQGDERDCIFISLGYGKAINSTSDSINFGPLNHIGGEKRLNVLISRAKYLCRVFASIHHHDIPIENNSNPGVQKLKTFLKFAETGEMDVPILSGDDYDSEFEHSVANAIRKLGYVVDGQVGSSGFKIDLAVRHQSRVGEYICGVECDGATYHSSLTARERDRIRQEILESRGWRFIRIWSTDWFRDKNREIIKIKDKLIQLSENINAI
jgi:superfamily I DNA and/or RNA helicase/very-short-patch-repair endonuclease